MVVIGQNCLYSAKRLYSVKKVCILVKWLYSGKSSFNLGKALYSSKSGCIRSKLLYSGKVVVIVEK